MGLDFENINQVKEKDLKKFNWIREGYYYDYTKNFWISEIKNNQISYNWSLLYDKEHYISVYEKRNKEIIDYFKKRTEDLLIFDVNENKDVFKILNFLSMNSKLNFALPHELKSNYK